MEAKIYSIHTLDESHLDQIAALHFSQLSMGVLTFFGVNFLRKMYSKLLTEHNWGYVVLGGEDSSSVLGFIFATTKEISLLKCLTLSSVFFFVRTTFLRASRLYTFFLAFKKIYFNKNDIRFIENNQSRLELAHFAIDEPFKSKGLGASLLLEFELKAKKNGFSTVFTRTHNKRLVDYYMKSRGASILSVTHLNDYDLYVLEWGI